MADNYNDAYKRYNWPVSTVDDLKLAPFHLLATEGRGSYGQRSRLAYGATR